MTAGPIDSTHSAHGRAVAIIAFALLLVAALAATTAALVWLEPLEEATPDRDVGEFR